MCDCVKFLYYFEQAIDNRTNDTYYAIRKDGEANVLF